MSERYRTALNGVATLTPPIKPLTVIHTLTLLVRQPHPHHRGRSEPGRDSHLRPPSPLIYFLVLHAKDISSFFRSCSTSHYLSRLSLPSWLCAANRFI